MGCSTEIAGLRSLENLVDIERSATVLADQTGGVREA
jgi:hypothetical protein